MVVGGGIVGMATALALVRLGLSTIVLERSTLDAAAGSSRGTARIYAPAPYPDGAYLEAGLRALEAWREIEAAAGERLLERTGALHTGAFADRQLESLDAAGAEAVAITAADAARRLGIHLPTDTEAVYQPDAGIIRAEHAWAAVASSARAAGAELRGGARAAALVDDGDDVSVETDCGELRCAAAVVVAGPWTAGLLAATGIEVQLEVSLQSVAFFDLPAGPEPPVALIDYEGDEPYACWDPQRGLKAALHARGRTVDPDARDAEDADAAVLETVATWAAARYPGLAPGPASAETCMYTNAPGERFVLERHGRIVVGSACSGQGFQFAPDTGTRLASLAAEAVA